MILDTIKAHVQQRLNADRKRTTGAALESRIATLGPIKDFRLALQAPGLQVISEVKRASPSAGDILLDADAVAISRKYVRNGAAAISVLTERDFFKGSIVDLQQVAQAVDVPVLRKDFILDNYQILEARAAGASAFLLIVRMLTPEQLGQLLRFGEDLGLSALVEVHDADELAVAIETGATAIGINNRNLDTFEVDLDVSLSLRASIPDNCISISESGIRNPEDFRLIAAAGFDAVLVGEALMRDSEMLKNFNKGTE